MLDVKKRFEDARNKKTNFTNLYRDAKDYLKTGANPFHSTSPGSESSNTGKLVDSMPIRAAEKCVSNIMASIFPTGKKWLNFKLNAKYTNPPNELKIAVENIENVFFNIIANSNFYSEIGKALQDYIVGAGILQVRKGKSAAQPVIFQSCSINEIYWDENEKREIDTIFRHFKIKAHEVQNLWPDVTITPVLKQHIAKGDTIEIIECVYPAKIQKSEYKTATKMVGFLAKIVKSLAVETTEIDGFKYEVRFYRASNSTVTLGSNIAAGIKDNDADILLSQDITMNPWKCLRWLTAPDEIWPRGPALTALPDIRQLNYIKETQCKAIDYMLQPALITSAGEDIDLHKLDGKARTIIQVYDINSIRVLEINPRIDVSMAEIDRLHASINDTLFAEPLGAIDGAVKTATEITLRQQEMLKRMGPAFNILQSEFIKPLVDSVLAIMEDWGLTENISDMRVGDLDISYNSPLAAAQNRTDIENINEFLMSISQMYPKEEIAKAIPLSVLIRPLGDLFNIHPKLLPDDEMLNNYQNKQEQMQQAEIEALRNEASRNKA